MSRTLVNTTGLIFDGSQNYVSLGTMGNFGSSLGSGFYCKFDIKTIQTTNMGLAGAYTDPTGSPKIIIRLNEFGTTGKITLNIKDDNNNQLYGYMTSTYNYYDGNKHTVILTANFVTKIITISVDGNSQAIGYVSQSSLSFVNNFAENFYIGAWSYNNTVAENCACTLDNFQIGTSASVLYGNYLMNDNTGTTVADSSGHGNNGTLQGSPVPTWAARQLASGRTITSSSGLLFDGVQNYVSLGTMGDFGSNLGSGLYCKFDIKTTSTAQGQLGNFFVSIQLNTSTGGVANTNSLRLVMRDNNSLLLVAHTSSPSVITDGNKHTVIITATPATNTIAVSIDGTAQTITYENQNTPITFSNWASTNTFLLGATNKNGTIATFYVCTLDNFQIGTSSSNLYGNYLMTEGTGTTITDSSNSGSGWIFK